MNSSTINPTKKSDLLKVDPRSIVMDPSFNVRIEYGDMEELKNSIREHGVKIPLRGYSKDKNYHLIDGFRRLTAVRELLKEGVAIEYVPFIPDTKNRNEEDRVLDMLLYNSGKPLTEIEEAESYHRLINYGWSQVKIAQKVGKSNAHISNRLKLTGLTTFMKTKISEGILNVSGALKIVEQFPDEKDQKEFIEKKSKQGEKKIKATKVPSQKKPKCPKLVKMTEEVISLMEEQKFTEAKMRKTQGIIKFLKCSTPANALKILEEYVF